MQEKGVMIIAGGHQQYGKWAYNLAASIKKVSDVPIQVLTYDGGLASVKKDGLLGIFDYVDEAPYNILCRNGNRMPMRLKCGMYFASRFEKTIFIDADSIWLGNGIESLFDKLSGCGLQVGTNDVDEKYCDKSPVLCWGKMSDFEGMYEANSDVYTQCETSFVYFEDSTENDKFFNTCVSIHDRLDDKLARDPKKLWRGKSIVDEQCYTLATIEAGFGPRNPDFRPYVYADRKFDSKKLKSIRQDYYILTFNGFSTFDNCIGLYNAVVDSLGPNYSTSYKYVDKKKMKSLFTQIEL